MVRLNLIQGNRLDKKQVHQIKKIIGSWASCSICWIKLNSSHLIALCIICGAIVGPFEKNNSFHQYFLYKEMRKYKDLVMLFLSNQDVDVHIFGTVFHF